MRHIYNDLVLALSFCMTAVPSESTTRPTPSRLLQQPRIVGGADAKRNEFPYFVDLGGKCGGTLIAPGVVLSAAHCREYLLPGITYATVNPLHVKDGQGTRLKIVERLFHPYYDDEWSSYDVMLLRLEEPITLNATNTSVKLIVNEDPDFPPDNVPLTTIGFGELEQWSNRYPDILQKVELESVNLNICNQTMFGEILDDSTLCAGSQEKKDTCIGDSGGPLLYIDDNKHILTGVVSWGFGCAFPGMPGAYGRVSKGMDWIKKIVCDCWNADGAPFCSTDDTAAEKRTFVSTIAEEIFECPALIDSKNCENTPGYVDYWGDGCDWYEKNENPGCAVEGESPGGRGFKNTNAMKECCRCGGGKSVEPIQPFKFKRHQGCQDLPDWSDEFRDDCQWYEEHTEEGTCSGWGEVQGWKGFRKWTAAAACCHCGGGIITTTAPSQSMMPSPTDFLSAITLNEASDTPPSTHPTSIQSPVPSFFPSTSMLPTDVNEASSQAPTTTSTPWSIHPTAIPTQKDSYMSLSSNPSRSILPTDHQVSSVSESPSDGFDTYASDRKEDSRSSEVQAAFVQMPSNPPSIISVLEHMQYAGLDSTNSLKGDSSGTLRLTDAYRFCTASMRLLANILLITYITI